MSRSKGRVALVSVQPPARRELARYLSAMGFEVEECAELAVPTAYSAVVMVATDDAEPEALVTQVRSWMRLTRVQRVVVVTSKPAALRDLLVANAGRLSVLAAPAFGWDVVDALRSVVQGPSRGA